MVKRMPNSTGRSMLFGLRTAKHLLKDPVLGWHLWAPSSIKKTRVTILTISMITTRTGFLLFVWQARAPPWKRTVQGEPAAGLAGSAPHARLHHCECPAGLRSCGGDRRTVSVVGPQIDRNGFQHFLEGDCTFLYLAGGLCEPSLVCVGWDFVVVLRGM